MEFFISTSDAQRAIKLLGVTAKMNTTSIEGQVFIQTKDSSVMFSSTNGHSGISCEFPSKVITPGQVSLIYSKMKSFIMTMQPWNGEIGTKEFHFSSNPPKIKISVTSFHSNTKPSKSNLNLEQIKTSTHLPVVTIEEPNLILNSRIIKSAIDKALFAIDPNGTEDFMRGLRMCLANNTVSFTATNGRVVSAYVVSNEANLNEGEYFLPYNFLMGLRHILVDDSQLFFEISKQKIKISFDKILFWSSGLSYKHWPETDKVWALYDKSIEIKRDILLAGLSSFIDILDPNDYNRITMEMKEHILCLKTDSSLFEYPSISEDCDFVVVMDGRDLINSLNSLSDDDIVVKCLNESSGMIIETDGFDNQKAFITNLSRR